MSMGQMQHCIFPYLVELNYMFQTEGLGIKRMLFVLMWPDRKTMVCDKGLIPNSKPKTKRQAKKQKREVSEVKRINKHQ